MQELSLKSGVGQNHFGHVWCNLGRIRYIHIPLSIHTHSYRSRTSASVETVVGLE